MAKRPSWLSSREAAALLDVKLETLYAYTSRGLVESMPGPQGRGRRYARDSIERLKARHDARSGHAAVAAGALRFGEPTLETSISDIRSNGPWYRGHCALTLAERNVGFEAVFDLLISGELPQASWPNVAPSAALTRLKLPVSARPTNPSALFAAWLALAALTDDARHGSSDRDEHERARRLTPWLASKLSVFAARPPRRTSGTVAQQLLAALTGEPDPQKAALIDRALVLCADHELNASTFTARVAASAGADLYACLGAALNTLSGARHGGASARVEALLREIGNPQRATSVLRERHARGEKVPGFGQPLYPQGDPRGRALFELAAMSGARRRNREYECLLALTDAMREAGHPGPNLDAGLVALCSALDLPQGAPAALIAIGRVPGWVAHALEQRAQNYILRPRARYVPAATLTLGS
jgi:citrate synthase